MARLTNVSVTFFTTFNDKDADSIVGVYILDGEHRIAWKEVGAGAHWADGQRKGPFELDVVEHPTKEELASLKGRVVLANQTQDDWQFNCTFEFTLDDQTVWKSDSGSLSLSTHSHEISSTANFALSLYQPN